MKTRLLAVWTAIGLPLCLALALALMLGFTAGKAKSEPLAVRIGYPGAGADNRLFAPGDIVAVAHAGHYLEDEFANGGNTDSAFGSVQLLGLRDRGIVTLQHQNGSSGIRRRFGDLLTDVFEAAHPEIVQRVVSASVCAARSPR